MVAPAGDEQLLDPPDGAAPTEAVNGVGRVRVLAEWGPFAEIAYVGHVPQGCEHAAKLPKAAEPRPSEAPA